MTQLTSGRSGIPAKTLMVVAAVAVLVLVASLFAVRAIIGGSSPDAPGGLSLSADGGEVKAVWNGVSGADEYLLIRDDGTVVYSGPDTTAVDQTAGTGDHRYRLRAADSGRWSADSAESKVTVVSGWGTLAPMAAQFPKLLPQTPDAKGWQDITCRSMVRAMRIERGPSDTGSGAALIKDRMHCFNPKLVIQPAWMTSKDATDQLFTDISKNASPESVSWRYGTGYVVESEHAAYLRLADRDDVVFTVLLDAGGRKELLDVANQIPLDE
ncbi:hypothetical protein [Gordonia neofelifaecis]|uniref:Fibronectin type III domain-containing protein n=1 Tax=Gordonia neofelifaecis NRRL B-59395 TaxID=644548 RepID=F1YNY9_9ACTN|nr:hypothetical protein [Gordonia neofelifaecis]EGD53608.1 hypothetical protein SCNU_18192 [Gordonia neofelifaecis NRRL B-59395]